MYQNTSHPARHEHSPFLAPCKHWMFLFTFSGAAVEVVLTQFCFIPCCEPPRTESNDHIPQILWRHRLCKGTGSCVRQGDRAAALLPSTVVRTRSPAAAVESDSSSHLRCIVLSADVTYKAIWSQSGFPVSLVPDQSSSPRILGGPVLQCSSRGWEVHSSLSLESSPILGCFYRHGTPCAKTHSASVS